jgi:hypothetical protein
VQVCPQFLQAAENLGIILRFQGFKDANHQALLPQGNNLLQEIGDVLVDDRPGAAKLLVCGRIEMTGSQQTAFFLLDDFVFLLNRST